jgi:hypothetical protein
MTEADHRFTDADRAALAARGVPEAEARRQLALLASPPDPVVLDRPCTVGDGILVLDESRVDSLLARHAAESAAGRVSAFVPASGAATRMFQELLAARQWPGPIVPADASEPADRPGAETLRRVVAELPRFAFHGALETALAARGHDLDRLRAEGPWRPVLETLLDPDGLDYARRPKALLAFHRVPGGVRTAFEEHLVEAAALARGADGRCRLHFTVSPEHRDGFDALLRRAGPPLAARLGATWDVGFSEQHPGTDTLAADSSGGPFRGDDGALLFRPAGHGALLRNLGDCGGDLVFVKNIDNVTVDARRAPTTRWSRALVGLAAELSAVAHARRARLDDPADAAATGDAARFLRESLGESRPPESRAALADLLDRPVRVCGMVRNTGEPGGGPFWVRGSDGRVTRQVVEAAQVSPNPDQRRLLGAATHFNPVFLACALRDDRGGAWPLERFVDESAVIVTRKSAGGRDLLALERPGLWNGAMARWSTVFVEVPLEVFQPVKTVLDLLRPEHQG